MPHMNGALRVIGIDPGFDRTGFGVIDQQGSDAAWVAHGCITTPATEDFSVRLRRMRDSLRDLLTAHRPACVAVEQLFFQTNAKTAIKVGMARGVILLAIADAEIPLVELTPNQVKQGIAGWGNADKRQVASMVQRLLKLKEIPTPDDAADALAIAIVGGLVYRTRTRT